MAKLDDDKIKNMLMNTSVDANLNEEWNSIEELLDQKDKRRRGLFFWLISGGATVLIVGLIGLYLANGPNEQKNYKEEVNAEIYTQSETSEVIQGQPKHQKYEKENDEVITNAKPIKTYKPSKTGNNALNYQIVDIQNEEVAVSQTLEESPSIYSNASANIEQTKTAKATFVALDIQPIPALTPEAFTILPLETNNLMEVVDVPTLNSSNNISYFAFGQSGFYSSNASYEDGPFGDQLSVSFTSLSKVGAVLGAGFQINKRWNTSIGVAFKSERGVYRGQFNSVSQATALSDTAIVYTNSLGGNIYSPGNLTVTKTQKTVLQQYNYRNRLGLVLQSNYRILGPIYVGAEIFWSPIQWQSGLIVDQAQVIVPLSSIYKSNLTPKIGLELGTRFNVTDQIFLDIGGYYSPNQNMGSVAGIGVENQVLGGRLRVSYMIK